MIMYNAKIYLVVIFIIAFIIVVPLIFANDDSCRNIESDENIYLRKHNYKIETISNYKSGIVIDKNRDSIGSNYSVTIKRSVWRHNKGRSWEINKIYITEFEYNSVSLGDTVL